MYGLDKKRLEFEDTIKLTEAVGKISSDEIETQIQIDVMESKLEYLKKHRGEILRLKAEAIQILTQRRIKGT